MFPWLESRLSQFSFVEQYRCYSISLMSGREREELNYGGKIIMPASALEKLASLNIVYPMLFKLMPKEGEKYTHCGVLEFIAEEGRIYVPYWMMQQLLLEEGDMIIIKNVNLEIGTYVKLQPQSKDFLDISDPKAVLENSLRSFACLTKGDLIALNYNDRIYELLIMETQPGEAISIIEADVEVEFAPPVGYEEPKKKVPIHSEPITTKVPSKFTAFHGPGQSISGKSTSMAFDGDKLVNPVPIR
jgi:ubiquitin fusion degradation protein 1